MLYLAHNRGPGIKPVPMARRACIESSTATGICDADMRQGNNNRQRSRGRSGRKPQGQNPNRALDSNGPGGRLRGTAAQLAEKYTALARDARSNKDRVIVESLLQHAEHYQRMVNEANEAQAKQGEQQEANRREQQGNSNGAAQDMPKGDQPVNETPKVSDEQPEIAAASGDGDQPVVDAPAGEKPARRQRRSPSQRRTRTPKAEANGSDTEGDSQPAAPVDAAPEAPSAEVSE